MRTALNLANLAAACAVYACGPGHGLVGLWLVCAAAAFGATVGHALACHFCGGVEEDS